MTKLDDFNKCWNTFSSSFWRDFDTEEVFFLFVCTCLIFRVSFPQHPVLDEPIAEAVCIIADTDKWTVQVASSQRRATEVNRLGKEVLVSNLVSNLLQSTYQLYKLNLSPNFVSQVSQSFHYIIWSSVVNSVIF